MVIGIDARFVGPEGTGLGKYTEKLVENLSKIDGKNKYKVFLRKGNWSHLKLNQNFEKVLADVPWYSMEEQIKMAGVYRTQNLDLLHVPHFNVPILYNRPFIVTIHDLIHHDFSQESTTTKNPLIFKAKRAAYKFTIKNAVEKSKKIITPSNFVKSQIVKTFKIENEKINVIYEAAEDEYFLAEQKKDALEILKKYKINEPFIIYVGNGYPHKNLEKLLDVILELNSKGMPEIKLVMVIARGVFHQRLESYAEKIGIKKLVHFVGYIESSELPQIFTKAQAYVSPSLSEGFGIPALNAMAAGLPVVCSNIQTYKEIYESSAHYFDPNDAKQIKDKLREVVANSSLREKLSKLGKEQAKKYSWKKMAEETLKIYQTNVN